MAKSIKSISSFDEVLNFSSTGEPVISLYLIVDGARTSKKDYLTKLNSMINSKKKEISSMAGISKSQAKKINKIFEEIKNYAGETFRPESTSTLVIFTSGSDFWKEFRIPVIIKSRIIIIDEIHLLSNPGRMAKIIYDYFVEKSVEKFIGHYFGHGIGRKAHEPPLLALNSKQTLEENSVITVEPGLYIDGWGGVRIEDTVLVEKDGANILNRMSDQFISLRIPTTQKKFRERRLV